MIPHSLLAGPVAPGFVLSLVAGLPVGIRVGIPVGIPVGLAVGLTAGLIHFTTLHWSVRLLTIGSAGKALVVQLCRLGLLAAVFIVLARMGAPTLLSAALGLLLARHAVLRRVRRQA
jgi:F1F0 ATPase subunit 2